MTYVCLFHCVDDDDDKNDDQYELNLFLSAFVARHSSFKEFAYIYIGVPVDVHESNNNKNNSNNINKNDINN
jgi:hypothetical protein